MKCTYCDNTGLRELEYCTCPYGIFEKAKRGDLVVSDHTKKLVQEMIKKHEETLKRLSGE